MLIPGVLGYNFTTDVTLEFNSTDVILKTESGDVNYKINSSLQTYSKEININREDDFMSKVETAITNFTINYENIKLDCGQEVDRGLSNQQSWLSETFMPQVELMNGLQSDLDVCVREKDLSKQNNNNLQLQLNQINETTNKYLETLERENKVYAFSLAGVMLLITGMGAFVFYQRFKNNMPGGTFRK